MPSSSPAPEEAIRLLGRIAEMHSDQAPDSLVLWCDNARQPETILTLGDARAIAAWNRRAGGERERELEARAETFLREFDAFMEHADLYPDDLAEARNELRAALAGQTE